MLRHSSIPQIAEPGSAICGMQFRLCGIGFRNLLNRFRCIPQFAESASAHFSIHLSTCLHEVCCRGTRERGEWREIGAVRRTVLRATVLNSFYCRARFSNLQNPALQSCGIGFRRADYLFVDYFGIESLVFRRPESSTPTPCIAGICNLLFSLNQPLQRPLVCQCEKVTQKNHDWGT